MRTNIVDATGKCDTSTLLQQKVLLYDLDGSVWCPITYVLIFVDFDEIDLSDGRKMHLVTSREDKMIERLLYLFDEKLVHAGFNTRDTLCSPAKVNGITRNTRRVTAFGETNFCIVDTRLGRAGDDD